MSFEQRSAISFVYVPLIFALVLTISGCKPSSPDAARPTLLSHSEWNNFKTRFVKNNGRVVDTGNNNISHSEGQSYALLFALKQNDEKSFDQIWKWTRKNLQVRDDKLFSWRWEPGTVGGKITDPNNAADGDIFIAWALMRAGQKWNKKKYLKEARAILRDVRSKLLRDTPYGKVLLPGAQGFESSQGVTVNLSYWVFPAMEDFRTFDDDATWTEVISTGHQLLKRGRFGRWELPPDWLFLGENPALPENFQPHYGYNAIRIPLYLVWARQEGPHLPNFARYWKNFQPDQIPAFVNLKDDSHAEYAVSKGMSSVSQLGIRTLENSNIPPTFGELDEGDDYYSSSLLLLTKVAAAEAKER